MSNEQREQSLDEIIKQLKNYQESRVTIPMSEHQKVVDNLYKVQNHIVKQCNRYMFALCEIQAIAERSGNKAILRYCEVLDES